MPEHVAVWNRSGVPSQPDDRLDLDALKAAAQKGVSAFSESGQYISLPLDGRIDLLMPKPSKKVSFRDSTPSSSTAPGPPATTSSVAPIVAPKPQWYKQQADQSQTWDAVHYAPPEHGEPEMKVPMDTRYKPAWERPTAEQSAYHSQSRSQQSQYPTLPQNVQHDEWYKAYTQSAPDRNNVRAVFPWEKQGRQQAERVFPRGDTPPPHQHSMPRLSIQEATPTHSPDQQSQQSRSTTQPAQPPRSMAEAMASYKNAWDSDPRIGKYVDRLTGGQKSRHQHGSSDFGNVDPGSLQSMPGTPNKIQQSWPDHGNRSDASEDGDDEDDGDYEPDIGSSPPSLGRAAGQEIKSIPFSLPDGPGYYKSNAKYRDRQSQTDKPASRDQTVQAVEGHVSPAVPTQRLPSLSGRRPPHRSHPSSSSDTPKPATPAQGRQRPPIPFPTYNSQSSSSSRYPGQSPPQSHSPQFNDNSTTNPSHNTGTTRVFDPSTDVDMRKKDSHKVLSRFIQAGAFGQSGGAGPGGRPA